MEWGWQGLPDKAKGGKINHLSNFKGKLT